MNDTELELLARRSVQAVRDEAQRIASTDEAWRRLSAGRPPVDVGDRVAGASSIVGLQQMAPQAEHNTRRWVVAAAAVAVLVVGGIVVFDRGGDGSIAPADTLVPTVAPTPTSDDGAPSLPPSTLVTASSTAPELSADASIEETIHSPVDEYVDITDVVVDNPDPLVGEELHRFDGAGDGPNQLGFETGECSMCISPWGPVVTSNGRIVIADEVNLRWIVVTNGDPEVIPYPAGLRVTGQPAIDADDTIYAPTVSPDDAGRMSVGRLLVTTVDELAAPRLDAEIIPVGNSSVRFDGTAVVVNGDPVEGVEVPEFDVPDTAFGTSAGYATQVNVRWGPVHRTWGFGTTAIAGVAATTALTDGTVLVIEIDSQRLVALTTDGRAFRQPLPPVQLVSQNGFVVIDGDSIIRLEADGDDFVVRRYPLPQAPVVDPLDGVVMPDFVEPSLDDVPRLIPTHVSALDGVSLVRSEHADEPASVPTHSQLWARADSNGVVAHTVSITTNMTGAFATSGAPIDVPGRPRAYLDQMADDSFATQISMPGGTAGGVSVRTYRLPLDEALQIASEITWDPNGEGWAVPSLAGDDWVQIDSSWSSGAAARTLADESLGSNGTAVIEMTIAHAVPVELLGPSPGDGIMMLVTIGDRPALVYDDEFRRAIEWSPSSGTSVLIGSTTLDRTGLIALAESLIEVDQSTWDAFAPLDVATGDGCQSMFC